MEYLQNFIVQKFHPAIIVLGYNHQFGHHRDGNLVLLEKHAADFGYSVSEIERQLVDDIEVSSTKIRIALQEGNMQRAAHLLQRNYSLQGTVIKGKQVGRKLGFPTANIQVDEPIKLIPATGVYAVKVLLNDEKYNGMMNIGYNPTFNETKLSLEVNLFDFSEDIYNNNIKVEFIERTRDEKKFENIDDLIAAIQKDELLIRKILA